MDVLPGYYQRYLQFALARDLALYKGRMDAWTAPLERIYQEALDTMVATSEVSVDISGDKSDLLSGAYRIRAGI